MGKANPPPFNAAAIYCIAVPVNLPSLKTSLVYLASFLHFSLSNTPKRCSLEQLRARRATVCLTCCRPTRCMPIVADFY